jgi:5-methyltetrahydropteroyltriglutamate--homocysteine methyltransferase
MKRRTDRILTTHVSSLPRPPDLLDMMKANLTGKGGPVDATVHNQKLTSAVAACVSKQAECGLDIITDGPLPACTGIRIN